MQYIALCWSLINVVKKMSGLNENKPYENAFSYCQGWREVWKEEQAALPKRYQWTVPDTAAPWPGAQQAALLW